MIKKFLYKLKLEDNHPDDGVLLAYVDGELSSKQSTRTRKHLEDCWACRERLENIEAAISQFVKFRNDIQIPLSEAPPNKWSSFRRKLTELAAQDIVPDASGTGTLSLWQRFLNFAAISNLAPNQIRGGVATVAAVLVVALIWNLVSIGQVSAAELLQKATIAQNEKVNSTRQAVVYQKLEVKRQNSRPVDWEVWQDKSYGRFRHHIANKVPTTENEVSEEVSSLAQILKKNGFDPKQPISSAGFASWRNSLSKKRDTVTKIEGESGRQQFVLSTVNEDDIKIGDVSKAELTVRAADWHPFQQTLHVLTAQGEEIFRITELDFEVAILSDFSPSFFGENIQTEIAEARTPEEKAEPSPSPVESPSPEAAPQALEEKEKPSQPKKAPKAKRVIATSELEVEVLDLLNQAKADLGEQITVERRNGILRVRGLVESPKRKQEILSYLRPVSNNSAVRIEIQTVAEAVASNKGKLNNPVKEEELQTQNDVAAAENELIGHFGSQQKARSFASRIVGRSRRAMSRAYAMRRLAKQFSPKEMKSLSPQAKGKWLALIRRHASAFQSETSAIRSELKIVFGGRNVGASRTQRVQGISDIPQAVESLMSFASANDQVIRSAMTVSVKGNQFSAIKTNQFWRSLKTAEALAGKLRNVK